MGKNKARLINELNYENNEKKIKDSGLIFLYKGYGKSLYLCPKCKNKMWIKRKLLVKNTVCRNCMSGQSFGEEKTIEILKSKNISFDKEKTFKGLKGVNKGILRFDFYIKGRNSNFIIEIDGEQHKGNTDWGGNTKENDKVKNRFCLENNIKLYRIPYKYGKLNNLEKQLIKVLIMEELI